jgi:hypothetical protein
MHAVSQLILSKISGYSIWLHFRGTCHCSSGGNLYSNPFSTEKGNVLADWGSVSSIIVTALDVGSVPRFQRLVSSLVLYCTFLNTFKKSTFLLSIQHATLFSWNWSPESNSNIYLPVDCCLIFLTTESTASKNPELYMTYDILGHVRTNYSTYKSLMNRYEVFRCSNANKSLRWQATRFAQFRCLGDHMLR